jgi:hypothetical protein
MTAALDVTCGDKWTHIRCTTVIREKIYENMLNGEPVDFICNNCILQQMPQIDIGHGFICMSPLYNKNIHIKPLVDGFIIVDSAISIVPILVISPNCFC